MTELGRLTTRFERPWYGVDPRLCSKSSSLNSLIQVVFVLGMKIISGTSPLLLPRWCVLTDGSLFWQMELGDKGKGKLHLERLWRKCLLAFAEQSRWSLIGRSWRASCRLLMRASANRKRLPVLPVPECPQR